MTTCLRSVAPQAGLAGAEKGVLLGAPEQRSSEAPTRFDSAVTQVAVASRRPIPQDRSPVHLQFEHVLRLPQSRDFALAHGVGGTGLRTAQEVRRRLEPEQQSPLLQSNPTFHSSVSSSRKLTGSAIRAPCRRTASITLRTIPGPPWR